MRILAGLMIACWTMAACARGPVTRPTTRPTEWTVGEVTGIVQFRRSEVDNWKILKVGERLNLDAEVRTGPKSSARFVASGSESLVLGRLVITSLRKALEGGTLETAVYGRIRYEVDDRDGHMAVIQAPGVQLRAHGPTIDEIPLLNEKPGMIRGVLDALLGSPTTRPAVKRN